MFRLLRCLEVRTDIPGVRSTDTLVIVYEYYCRLTLNLHTVRPHVLEFRHFRHLTEQRAKWILCNSPNFQVWRCWTWPGSLPLPPCLMDLKLFLRI